jgi:ACR3 family arsenite transporter
MACVSKEVGNIFRGLSWSDRLLPFLILITMIGGVLISVYHPSAREAFNGTEFLNVSIPLLVGLIVMMVPPLCKVEWENVHRLFLGRKRLTTIALSLLLNWIVGPFIMLGLAWLTLFDLDEYRTGIIMVGLARCIAMVLLWNQIAQGDNELCAVLVIINSVLQLVLYAPYQIFFCYVISNNNASNTSLTYFTVFKTVSFFMGIPMALGFLIRFSFLKTVGKETYNKRILPFISPWALIGLLYTIAVIFIEKGDDFVKDIGSAFRCFVPLVAYFLITWFGTFFLVRFLMGRSYSTVRLEDGEIEKVCGCEKTRERASLKQWTGYCGANYEETITQTFVASSNNFELSIAVAVSLYGNGSKEAIAATFGPLLEVPILLVLAFLARFFKEKFLWADDDGDDDEDVVNVIE